MLTALPPWLRLEHLTGNGLDRRAHRAAQDPARETEGNVRRSRSTEWPRAACEFVAPCVHVMTHSTR